MQQWVIICINYYRISRRLPILRFLRFSVAMRLVSEARSRMDPVEAFRRQTGGGLSRRKEPLCLRDKLILASLTIQIAFLGWSMGGLRVWSVVALTILNVVGFILLFVPLGKKYAFFESPHGPWASIKRLLRWPFFWFSLLFLVYITIQNLNPAWEYTTSTDGKQWWLAQIPHNKSLPTGMAAPFEKMNGWRVFMVFASALMLVSTIWCGIKRRKHLLYLLWVSVVSTTIMVIVGLIQRFTGTNEILWFLGGVPNGFFGTFTYKNHAGAFIVLNIVLSFSLGIYYFCSIRHHSSKSSPQLFLFLLAVTMALGVFFTDSRGSMIVLFGVFLVTLLLWIVVIIKRKGIHVGSGLSFFLLASVIGFSVYLLTFLDLERIEHRLTIVLNDVLHLEQNSPEEFSNSAKRRYFLYIATWKMVCDNPLFGWGAGGYRYYFPVYQQQYPFIYYFDTVRWRRNSITNWPEKYVDRRYWGVDNAHCDWLQFSAEFGIVGCGFLVLGILSLLVQVMGNIGRVRPWMLVAFVGCIGTLAHSLIEFVFQCPSILLLWILIPVIVVKNLQLKESGGELELKKVTG